MAKDFLITLMNPLQRVFIFSSRCPSEHLEQRVTQPMFQYDRRLQSDVDQTYLRSPLIPLKTIDTRKQKL